MPAIPGQLVPSATILIETYSDESLPVSLCAPLGRAKDYILFPAAWIGVGCGGQNARGMLGKARILRQSIGLDTFSGGLDWGGLRRAEC